MTIIAAPGASFSALAAGFPSGLVGTLGVRIVTDDGTVVLARQTSGIIEIGGGTYRADLVSPPAGGRYLVAWDDAVGPWVSEDLVVTATPIDVVPTPDPVWAPTVADVAALLRARTKDANGNEVGTFDATTRPTDGDVLPLIANGCADVASYVGWDLPAELHGAARNLASIYAAVQIEEGYWPEQVNTDRSSWQQLWQRYQAGVESFVEYAGAIAGPGTVGSRQGSLYTPTPDGAVLLARLDDCSFGDVAIDASLASQREVAAIRRAASPPAAATPRIPGLLPGVQTDAAGQPAGRVFDRIAWRQPRYAKRKRR